MFSLLQGYRFLGLPRIKQNAPTELKKGATVSTTFSTEPRGVGNEGKAPPGEPQVPKNRGFPGFYSAVSTWKAIRKDQMARGPRSSRTGSIKIALTSPRTPWTAMPTRRNGKVSSQTIGYSTRASRASGQHRMNRMTHRKKAAMATSFVTTARRSVRSATAERPASTLYYETERGKVPSTAYSLSRRRLAMDAGTSASSHMCESSISE